MLEAAWEPPPAAVLSGRQHDDIARCRHIGAIIFIQGNMPLYFAIAMPQLTIVSSG